LEAEAYKFFVAGCIHGCGRGYCWEYPCSVKESHGVGSGSAK
jgi:hypothetical protein